FTEEELKKLVIKKGQGPGWGEFAIGEAALRTILEKILARKNVLKPGFGFDNTCKKTFQQLLAHLHAEGAVLSEDDSDDASSDGRAPAAASAAARQDNAAAAPSAASVPA